MVSAQARFQNPTRFGDEIAIETRVAEFGRSSFKIEHRLLKGDVLAVELFETRVWAIRRTRHRAPEIASDSARSAFPFAGRRRLTNWLSPPAPC